MFSTQIVSKVSILDVLVHIYDAKLALGVIGLIKNFLKQINIFNNKININRF